MCQFGWITFPGNLFPIGFWLGWTTSRVLEVIWGEPVKLQAFCSSHALSLIFWLTLLAWSRGQACNCFTLLWILLQLLPACVLSSVMKGLGFCRTSTPLMSDATRNDKDFCLFLWALAHACGFHLVLALHHFTSFFPSQLPAFWIYIFYKMS